jgi:hypothetical protein
MAHDPDVTELLRRERAETTVAVLSRAIGVSNDTTIRLIYGAPVRPATIAKARAALADLLPAPPRRPTNPPPRAA